MEHHGTIHHTIPDSSGRHKFGSQLDTLLDIQSLQTLENLRGGCKNVGKFVTQTRNKNIWANYNDLTATSLEIIVSKGNHPQMALIQVSEIL